jgi:hypothetical protein
MLWIGFAEMRSGAGPTPQPKKPGAPGGPKDEKAPKDPNAPQDELLEEEEESGEVASVLGDLAPWAMSILIHAAMVLIAILWVRG